MKAIITTSVIPAMLLLLSIPASAQAPSKMSYQAIIRSNSGQLVTSQQVRMRITILQGIPDGTAVYTETITGATNPNGLVTAEIGSGAGFATIDWNNGPR
jgi:trimeric autotransporter adhesin